MAYDNIRFTKYNMSVVDNNFFAFDHTYDKLVQKTDGGDTVFEYPLDIDLTTLYVDDVFVSNLGAVLSTQYDRTYFWTLQLLVSNQGIVIRKWLLDNYICRLQKNFVYENTSENTYYSRALGVEHYLTEFSSNFSAGSSTININKYYNTVVTSGTVLDLGPNTSNQIEYITVSGVVGNDVVLSGTLQYSYDTGDQVGITRSFFVFNDYDGTSSPNGSLIRFNSLDGSYMYAHADVDYKTIFASTFSSFQNILPDYPDVDSLVYIKGSNAKLRSLIDFFEDPLNASSVNDDFTDDDGSLPNTTRWSITNGNPRIYNNALFCSTVINGTDEIKSNYEFIGDFNAEVSGTVGGYTAVSGIDFIFEHYFKLVFPHNEDKYYEGGYSTSYLLSPAPTNGLIREYTFESYSGTTLFDTSTVGSNATMYSIDIVSGLVDDGGQIGSKTDYITLNSTVGGSIVSVSLYYYFNGTGGNWTTIVCRHGGTYHHILTDPSGYIGFYNNAMYSSGYQLTAGNWYHLVLIKNGTNSKLYIDKILRQNSGSSFSNNSWPIGILGNQASGGDQGALGILDQIRIYNRVLTVSEIDDLYSESYYVPVIEERFYTADNGELDVYMAFPSTEFNYKLRVSRSNDELSFYYKTTTSGVFDTNWSLFDTMTSHSNDCRLSLGLYSSDVTVSGSYFDDLVCSGYVKYPLLTPPYYGVMNMDNVRANGSTIITVYDMSIVGDSMYRLQDEATYYGSDNDWGAQYNYQVSPIRPFIDFITVGTSPDILPATGRNISQVTAVVLDQYGEGAINKPVHFTDDDSIGFITIPDVYTDYFHGTGEAKTNYMSGVAIRLVTVEGTATQYD